MHPQYIYVVPRVNEISKEIDRYSRVAYFRQIKYELYVRMSILVTLLKK